MGTIIKKASKKTIVSLLSLIGLLLALVTRIFMGGSSSDLSKLGGSETDRAQGNFLIDVANADYPQTTDVTTVTTASDGGGGGSCGGSASGAGGDSSDW